MIISPIGGKKNYNGNIMKTGRFRWKIENETFNTLKNLGYHFEHNYPEVSGWERPLIYPICFFNPDASGLAFLIDQIIQAACHSFKTIEFNLKTKIKFWRSIKASFQCIHCQSMEHIYYVIAHNFDIQLE